MQRWCNGTSPQWERAVIQLGDQKADHLLSQPQSVKWWWAKSSQTTKPVHIHRSAWVKTPKITFSANFMLPSVLNVVLKEESESTWTCNTRLKQKMMEVRFVHLFKAVCGRYSSSAMEQCSDEWVPVLLMTSPRRRERRKSGHTGTTNYQVHTRPKQNQKKTPNLLQPLQQSRPDHSQTKLKLPSSS